MKTEEASDTGGEEPQEEDPPPEITNLNDYNSIFQTRRECECCLKSYTFSLCFFFFNLPFLQWNQGIDIGLQEESWYLFFYFQRASFSLSSVLVELIYYLSSSFFIFNSLPLYSMFWVQVLQSIFFSRKKLWMNPLYFQMLFLHED